MKFQSTIFSSIPNSAIAGFIVEAGEYLPCPALSKNGLLTSLISLLNSNEDMPLERPFTLKVGVLRYVTIDPDLSSKATTAPLLLSICSKAIFCAFRSKLVKIFFPFMGSSKLNSFKNLPLASTSNILFPKDPLKTESYIFSSPVFPAIKPPEYLKFVSDCFNF